MWYGGYSYTYYDFFQKYEENWILVNIPWNSFYLNSFCQSKYVCFQDQDIMGWSKNVGTSL